MADPPHHAAPQQSSSTAAADSGDTTPGPSTTQLTLSDSQSLATSGAQQWPPSIHSSITAHDIPKSPGDRVYPMRSVVSVDPSSTLAVRQDLRQDGYFQGASFSQTRRRTMPTLQQNDQSGPDSPTTATASGGAYYGTSRSNLPRLPPSAFTQIVTDAQERFTAPETPSIKSARSENAGRDEQSLENEYTTTRFTHIVTDDGHAIITGREGESLQRCEDEPIHMPGAIQSYGLLIVLEEDDGKFLVKIASENSTKIIGYSPKQLFSLETFTDILTEEQAENLLDHIDFVRDEETDVERDGPELFTMSVAHENRRPTKLWCAMHINARHPEYIICEFEMENDVVNPPIHPSDVTPEIPEDTLDSTPTMEDYIESTQNMSKPLRILRSARKNRGEQATMEVFNIMSQIQEQLAAAPTLEMFLKVLVGVVKELSGFHRVMIYQFDKTFNGRVVTELVDPRATKDLYKGLHFPASDIPKQARDLYKINRVRLLYDRSQETSRFVCRTSQDLETPLDLTHSYLRAMSPIHIKYLANMAVRASMSISINAFNELWGLISCHSYGQKGMRVSFPIRKMCRLVGDTASRNIERLSYASRLQARKLINTVPSQHNPSGYIIASSEDLLKLFNADYGLISIQDETKVLGNLDQMHEALAMLEYLKVRKMMSVVTSQNIREDFPDLLYRPGFQVLAGMLVVPLSASGADFIVFFRKGVSREVRWAGNPYEKTIRDGTQSFLEPRKSFKTWSETVIGKCREWTEEEIETAAVLCLVYGKFIEVWRLKEAALQNSQLTKLLLANSAHEVRTPLNAIINYLEIAMENLGTESALDRETRDYLTKSHSASKSLIYVINDLLDLTKTEEGSTLNPSDVMSLEQTITEATDAYHNEAKRKAIDYEVTIQPGIPKKVLGDVRKIRQAISNIVANAIKHTSKGGVTVEAYVAFMEGSVANIDIAVQDTGSGMSPKQVDALFMHLEQVQLDSPTAQKSIRDGEEPKSPEDDKALGLGLAVVARIVRNMNGQLRLKSKEGEGSRFVIQLPFQVSNTEMAMSGAESPAQCLKPPSTPMDEVLLIDRDSIKSRIQTSSHGLIRSGSQENIPSKGSNKSLTGSIKSQTSVKSDVDRLIEAIQVPHMTETKRHSGSTLLGGKRPLPGQHTLQFSGTPIKPVKVADDESLIGGLGSSRFATPGAVLGEIKQEPKAMQTLDLGATKYNVLVAEDDPVNSKIIKKRLERSGHIVHLTVNGKDCATAYGSKDKAYDIILMDMQMPIVDGLTSTKMIREMERLRPVTFLSDRAALNGRVPIVAVSASLLERERQVYMDAGFDAWILKPVNFQRLNELMTGIVNQKVREDALYKRGEWEKGGWFHLPRPVTPPAAEPAHPSDIPGQLDGSEAVDLVDFTQVQPQLKSQSTPAFRVTGPVPDSTDRAIQLTEQDPVQSPQAVEE